MQSTKSLPMFLFPKFIAQFCYLLQFQVREYMLQVSIQAVSSPAFIFIGKTLKKTTSLLTLIRKIC